MLALRCLWWRPRCVDVTGPARCAKVRFEPKVTDAARCINVCTADHTQKRDSIIGRPTMVLCSSDVKTSGSDSAGHRTSVSVQLH